MAKQAAQKQKENAIVRYFRETWFELKKVSWPTRSEARNLTLIVILATTALAIILSVIDYFITLGFSLFLG